MRNTMGLSELPFHSAPNKIFYSYFIQHICISSYTPSVLQSQWQKPATPQKVLIWKQAQVLMLAIQEQNDKLDPTGGL